MTNSYSDDGVVHPDQHAFVFVDESKWIIGNDGGLWSTSNSGEKWDNRNTDLNTIQFVSVTPDPKNNLRIFGGSQDNGTAIKGEGTLAWNLTLSGDGGYTQIDSGGLQPYFCRTIPCFALSFGRLGEQTGIK